MDLLVVVLLLFAGLLSYRKYRNSSRQLPLFIQISMTDRYALPALGAHAPPNPFLSLQEGCRLPQSCISVTRDAPFPHGTESKSMQPAQTAVTITSDAAECPIMQPHGAQNTGLWETSTPESAGRKNAYERAECVTGQLLPPIRAGAETKVSAASEPAGLQRLPVEETSYTSTEYSDLV